MTNSPLAYYRVRDTWYHKLAPIPHDTTVLMVGDYGKTGGGCTWEFALCEEEQTGRPLRLKMFSESWPAFTVCPAFFTGLADLGDDASEDEVIELMNSLGFIDRTEESRP